MASVIFLFTALLLLSGCLSHSKPDHEKATEAFNAIGKAAEGASAAFAYPERSKALENDPKHVSCAGSRTKTERLCADSYGEKTRWFLLSETNEETTIEAGDFSAERLQYFEVDRQWRYIAMVITEEGHPFLAVYDLKLWLDEKKKPSPLFIVHPYPDSVFLSGWSNNQLLGGLGSGSLELRFSSDTPDLTVEHQPEPSEEIDEYEVSKVMRSYRYLPHYDELKVDRIHE